MKAVKGIWTVSKGKGNRVYVNCNDGTKVSHSSELLNMNGLAVYGLNNLKDLAFAILNYQSKLRDEEDKEVNELIHSGKYKDIEL